MQYVEGQSLAEMIHRLQQLSGREAVKPGTADSQPTGPYLLPSVPLEAPLTANTTQARAAGSTVHSTRSPAYFQTVAELAVQATEALEHAHGLGVVHRDIKPGNLLADASGKLWITDFGLAQFQSEAGLTRTGDLVGTLRYMSPEQALAKRGLVDHRTDLYSLGATLYELLTLEPAFNGCDREELLRQIAFEEPRPPRRLNKAIPADLETIVLKAMAKSVEERYATAQELADDLHRFLRQESILARRPTLAQRARKWLRRHPSVLVAGSVLLVLLAVGSFISAGVIRGAYERERQRAEEAEKQFQLARRAADDMIQMAEGDLADDPFSSNLRRQLLEAALAYYQEFIEQRREDPSAQRELEITRDRVKKIIGDLAAAQGAGQLFLLNHPAVLDDLGLPEEKRNAIANLLQRRADQRHGSLRDFHRLTAAQRRQRFLEVARADEAAVAEVLSPEQVRRLRQIALQTQGPSAFREPEIAAALTLTAQQRERIRAIEADLFPVRLEWHASGEPLPARKGEAGWSIGGERRASGEPLPEPPEQPHPPNLRAARDKMLAVLTAEQKAKWEEMTGKPFEGKLPFHFRVRTLALPGPFGKGIKTTNFGPP
jgi:hypothetical protein